MKMSDADKEKNDKNTVLSMEVERYFTLAVKADAEHEQRQMKERTKQIRCVGGVVWFVGAGGGLRVPHCDVFIDLPYLTTDHLTHRPTHRLTQRLTHRLTNRLLKLINTPPSPPTSHPPLREKLEEEKQKTYEITRDMTRQYKDMQDELSDKVVKLEATIKNLEDEMLKDRAEFQDTLRKKDQVITDQETEMKNLHSKMEGMAAEFGDMLQRTLGKMKERIELNSANFEEQAVPINKRLEEYHLKE